MLEENGSGLVVEARGGAFLEHRVHVDQSESITQKIKSNQVGGETAEREKTRTATKAGRRKSINMVVLCWKVHPRMICRDKNQKKLQLF